MIVLCLLLLVFIFVSGCFHYTKNQSKEKHLLQYHDTNSELKGIDVDNI